MENFHPISGEFKFTIFQGVCMLVFPLQPNFFHLLNPYEPSKWQMFISPEYQCLRRSSHAVQREARGFNATAGVLIFWREKLVDSMPPRRNTHAAAGVLTLWREDLVDSTPLPEFPRCRRSSHVVEKDD